MRSWSLKLAVPGPPLTSSLVTVFESSPLSTPLHVLGLPTLSLRLRCPPSPDNPRPASANLIARLCHVSEDGSSLLLSRGVLNLTHRHGHRPQDLAPITTGTRQRTPP